MLSKERGQHQHDDLMDKTEELKAKNALILCDCPALSDRRLYCLGRHFFDLLTEVANLSTHILCVFTAGSLCLIGLKLHR